MEKKRQPYFTAKELETLASSIVTACQCSVQHSAGHCKHCRR